MYIADTRHFLDEKGAIGPRSCPAEAVAVFHAAVIAYATDFEETDLAAPTCFECRKATVQRAIAHDEAMYWSCLRCNAEGRTSHWRGTRWDLSDRPDPQA